MYSDETQPESAEWPGPLKGRPELPAGSLGHLRASSRVPAELIAASAPSLLRGASGDPGWRWWSWALRWPRPDSGSAGEEACSPGGLPGLSQIPWPTSMASQLNITLPFLTLSWQHVWGLCFVLSVFHARQAHLANEATNS